MSLESKINLLLSQAKDDPRFKQLTSTSLRMGSISVPGDPLLSGVDAGVAPLLSGGSTNTPQFLDLRLELFVVLKANIDDVKAIVNDFYKEIIVSKELEETIALIQKATKEVFKPLEESINLQEKVSLEQKAFLENSFNVQDDFRDRLQNKGLLSSIESRQQIFKLIKEEFLRRQFRKEYPLYELANRLSKDYGVVGGFGRDFNIGGEQADKYYWLDGSAWLGLSAINRHPKYGIINTEGVGSAEIPPLAPIFVSGISNPPFWYGNTGGWLYWWMPGYGLQSGSNVFEDDAYTGVPNSSGYVNRRNNIYVWNLTNSNPYIPNFFTNPTDFNYWKKHPQEVISAQTLPASSEIINESGELVQFANEIIQFLRKSFQKPVEVVKTKSLTLVPRAQISKETINSISSSNFFLDRVAESTNTKTVSEINELQLDKVIREIASIKASAILPSKSKLEINRISIEDEELKKLLRTIPIKAELDDRSKLKVTKSEGEGETVGKLKSSLLINPAFSDLRTDKLLSIIEKRFKVFKETENKVKTLSATSKNPNRGEREVFDIRDSVLTPSKSHFDTDKLLSITDLFKELKTPKTEKINLIEVARLKPDRSAKENLDLISSAPLVPTAKIAFDRVFLISELEFDRELKPESIVGWDEKNEFINKYFAKGVRGLDKGKLKSFTINPRGKILGTKIGVKAQDRDSGFFGDVFYLFNRSPTKDLAQTVSFAAKLFNRSSDSHFTVKDSSLSPKAKIIIERLLSEDTRHGFLIGKVLTEQDLFVRDHKEVKDIFKKPKTSVINSNIFVLSPKSKLNIDAFRALDDFNPWLLSKIENFIFEAKDKPSKSLNTGINDTLSSSMKGYAFIRDEDYVKGAYFLQPYVATIPPGRSRQF